MRDNFKSRKQPIEFICRTDRAVCTLVQDDSEKNEGFEKAVSRYENRVAFQKSCLHYKSKYGKQKSRSQYKPKYGKLLQSCRMYHQAQEIFFAVT